MKATWALCKMITGTALLAAALACHNPPPPTVPSQIPVSTIFNLSNPALAQMGAIEGPFTLARVVGTATIQLVNADKKEQQVGLIGLRGVEYPKPVDPKATPTPPPTPEQVATQKQHATALANFQIKALSELIGKRTVYIQRPGRDGSQLAYVYELKDSSKAKNGQPNGKASVINAEAVRNGVAIDDTLGLPHIFSEMMMDCQAAALIESQKHSAQGKDAPDIWTRFDLTPPPNIDQDMLDRIRLRLK